MYMQAAIIKSAYHSRKMECLLSSKVELTTTAIHTTPGCLNSSGGSGGGYGWWTDWWSVYI